MHNKEISSTPKNKAWHTSSGLALCLMIVSLITWVAILCMTVGIFEIKPTQMLLKSDGCSFLHENGITTKNTEAGSSSCTVNVPFRSDSFGNGGVIILNNDRQIKIASNQVVLVGSIENQPWTPSQNRSAILIGVSWVFMFGMMAWFFTILFSRKY